MGKWVRVAGRGVSGGGWQGGEGKMGRVVGRGG